VVEHNDVVVAPARQGAHLRPGRRFRLITAKAPNCVAANLTRAPRRASMCDLQHHFEVHETATVLAAALLVSVSMIASAQQSAKNTEAQSAAETATAAFYAEPFDFKGIRLGMTVSEFKAAPLPVPKG